MSFNDHDKMYNWPTRRHPPRKMSHGEINMLPYHAFDDKSSKVALTDHEWKAVIKIPQFICSLPRKTDRHHRDRKSVQLLVMEIVELNSRIKVLEECQKVPLTEIATLQGDITVDKFEEKRNVIHCPSPPPSMRSKKYFWIGDGGDRHGGI